ncbi:cyclopentanone 1, 2-monooxygenase [Colletotrichum karsti]|uniref:Cyclopentanone 1, 2-monooxygenase n=1 Tax=Colletotrichum karsti TaxID=1095194 RepID=A0A9P6HTW8_9PEZI|nr:cyclopentanone 1, 2-monooxygenase [Colletotrichum karsti]KAF9870588.1 cyclopentanone 1, 2-monooxygenase [Colletotrichum karsti]
MGSLDQPQSNGITAQSHFDVIIIGGGFGGCYSLHKLRKLGFSTHLFEAGYEYGGVWHWNSYPGARVDSEVPYYQFSLPEVYKTWSWSQRFPGHDELKRYFRHVGKVLDLEKDTSFKTTVNGADFDERHARWTISTNTGLTATCKYLIPATGNSYKPFVPHIDGMDDYEGQVIHSSDWSSSPVETQGKNVAIVGSGATGVQLVQEISKHAEHLTVYLRNPNIALPMRQRELSQLEQDIQKGILRGLFELSRQTPAGMACDTQVLASSDVAQAEREAYWDELWSRGGFSFQAANYCDFLVDAKANRMIYGFWVKRVRARIHDAAKREIVAPLEPPFPFATKRSSLEQDYYESLDRENVEIVPLKKTPIREFWKNGIVTSGGEEVQREHDVVIMATGFDNMTGSLTSMGLRGKNGVDMKKRWRDGVRTHLGIMVHDCPNMFMVFGPQAPTAFTNAPVFIESQVDLIADFLTKLRDAKVDAIEPRVAAQEQWNAIIQEMNDHTLFPLCDSWYMGANIPGKKREQLNYIGGMNKYEDHVREAFQDWTQFHVVWEDGRSGAAGVGSAAVPPLR